MGGLVWPLTNAAIRSSASWAGTGSLLVTLGVVALLSIPLASARPAYGGTPPFSGLVTFSSETKSHCGVGFGVHPTANNSSGSVALKYTVRGIGIWQPLRGSYVCSAFLDTVTGFLGPAFTVRTTGAHLVGYRWSLGWVTNGSQSSNLSRPAVNISVIGNVYDLTTGSWVLGGNHSTNASLTVFTAQCGTATGLCWHSANSATRTLQLNVTLIAGHRYELLTGISTTSLARGGLAFTNHMIHPFGGYVQLNLGTAGRGASLLRLSVR